MFSITPAQYDSLYWNSAAGLVAKVAAEKMTKNAAENLGNTIRAGGKAAGAYAPVPDPGLGLGAILTNAGINASLNRADPDSRAGALARVLAQHAGEPDDTVASAFGRGAP